MHYDIPRYAAQFGVRFPGVERNFTGPEFRGLGRSDNCGTNVRIEILDGQLAVVRPAVRTHVRALEQPVFGTAGHAIGVNVAGHGPANGTGERDARIEWIASRPGRVVHRHTGFADRDQYRRPGRWRRRISDAPLLTICGLT